MLAGPRSLYSLKGKALPFIFWSRQASLTLWQRHSSPFLLLVAVSPLCLHPVLP